MKKIIILLLALLMSARSVVTPAETLSSMQTELTTITKATVKASVEVINAETTAKPPLIPKTQMGHKETEQA